VVQQQWLAEHGAALCASVLQPAGGGGAPRVSQFNHIHAAMVASWARMEHGAALRAAVSVHRCVHRWFIMRLVTNQSHHPSLDTAPEQLR
jgi:hypothetical protein